jgi:hypothetical protein
MKKEAPDGRKKKKLGGLEVRMLTHLPEAI